MELENYPMDLDDCHKPVAFLREDGSLRTYDPYGAVIWPKKNIYVLAEYQIQLIRNLKEAKNSSHSNAGLHSE